MGSKDTEPRWISWIILPIAFVAMGVSMYLGDMAFICLKYGHRAYFVEGLRFIKHKPYTLSNGEILSQDTEFLAWLASVVIWLALTIAIVAILVGVSRLLRRARTA